MSYLTKYQELQNRAAATTTINFPYIGPDGVVVYWRATKVSTALIPIEQAIKILEEQEAPSTFKGQPGWNDK